MVKKLAKIRLDQLLIERSLVNDLAEAQARIMAGLVIVDEHRVDKPGIKFSSDVEIRVKEKAHPYVSRGALKLEHALNIWPIIITNKICLDVGASTGGFTQVMLNHGAKIVYAVDVGHAQLAEKLRCDLRVINMERTHILQVKDRDLVEKPNVASIDVSFISLKKILPHVVKLMAHDSIIIALIKPQFEANPCDVGAGGIVREPLVRSQVVADIKSFASNLGLVILGVEESPITGAKGNIEYLLGLKINTHFLVVPRLRNS